MLSNCCSCWIYNFILRPGCSITQLRQQLNSTVPFIERPSRVVAVFDSYTRIYGSRGARLHRAHDYTVRAKRRPSPPSFSMLRYSLTTAHSVTLGGSNLLQLAGLFSPFPAYRHGVAYHTNARKHLPPSTGAG